jgi:hypothetical protein
MTFMKKRTDEDKSKVLSVTPHRRDIPKSVFETAKKRITDRLLGLL